MHFSADMLEEHHGEKAVLKPYAVITLLALQTTKAHKIGVPNKEDWASSVQHLTGMVAKKFTLIRNQFYCNKIY